PWITVPATLLTVLLYWLLIPCFGALGAAAAALGGFFCHAVLTYAVTQRVYRVRYEPLRLGGTLLLAAAFVLVSPYVANMPYPLLGKLGLWATWPVLLWVT